MNDDSSQETFEDNSNHDLQISTDRRILNATLGTDKENLSPEKQSSWNMMVKEYMGFLLVDIYNESKGMKDEKVFKQRVYAIFDIVEKMTFFDDEVLFKIIEVKHFFDIAREKTTHPEKLKFLIVTLTTERSKMGKCGNIWCQNKSRFTCSKCNLVKYCSNECNVKYWRAHKEECRALSTRGQIKDICLNKIECSNFTYAKLIANLFTRKRIKKLDEEFEGSKDTTDKDDDETGFHNLDGLPEDYTASVHAKKKECMKILLTEVLEEAKGSDDYLIIRKIKAQFEHDLKKDDSIAHSTMMALINAKFLMIMVNKEASKKSSAELYFLNTLASRDRNHGGFCANIMCNKKWKIKCPKCQHVSYCSSTCREKEWPKHKLNCETARLHRDCKKHCLHEVD